MKIISTVAGTVTLAKNLMPDNRANCKRYQLIANAVNYTATMLSTVSTLAVHLHLHSKTTDTILLSSEDACLCLLLSLRNSTQARIATKELLLHEHSFNLLHLPAPAIEITLLAKQDHECFLFCFPRSWLLAYTYTPISAFLDRIESDTIARYKEGHTIATGDMLHIVRSLDRAQEHTTITSNLRLLLTEALRTIDTQPIYEPVKLKEAQLMYKVKRFIDSNLAQPKLSTKHIAGETHIGEHYIKTYFERVYGSTAHDYINDLRLSRSIDLLADYNHKVKDIAKELGFDPSTFTRLFNKRYGMKPKEFRAAMNMQKG